MGIMLGNLSIKDIEKRAGVEFPEELVEYMETRRQAKASKTEPGKWHCFDLPFVLVCGDKETAEEIVKRLTPLSGEFKEPLQIALS